jgi:hypothetical protein
VQCKERLRWPEMFVNMSAGSLYCVAGWTHHCVGRDTQFRGSCAAVFYGVPTAWGTIDARTGTETAGCLLSLNISANTAANTGTALFGQLRSE